MGFKLSPGCCCGSGNCVCPGCVNCKDNKSPASIKLRLKILTGEMDLDVSPCNNDCLRIVYSDYPTNTVKRVFEFIPPASPTGNFCKWELVPQEIELSAGCESGIGAVTATGELELQATGDPEEFLGVATILLGSLATLVFKRDIVTATGELVDCNGTTADDALAGPEDSWIIDLAESSSTYCDLSELVGTVTVTKCSTPCCENCVCCGEPVDGVGKKITHFAVNLHPWPFICGDDDCGTTTLGCPSLYRRFNEVVAEQNPFIVPVSAFLACGNGNKTFGPFSYPATVDPPTFGDDTGWYCSAGTFTIEIDVNTVEVGDDCVITVSPTINAGPGAGGSTETEPIAKPLSCPVDGSYGTAYPIPLGFAPVPTGEDPTRYGDVAIKARVCENTTVEPMLMARSRGLGDTVAKITTAIGITPCGGCKQRQEALNKAFPYGT